MKNLLHFLFDDKGDLKDEFRLYRCPLKDGTETVYHDRRLWGTWAGRLEQWENSKLGLIPDWYKVSKALEEALTLKSVTAVQEAATLLRFLHPPKQNFHTVTADEAGIHLRCNARRWNCSFDTTECPQCQELLPPNIIAEAMAGARKRISPIPRGAYLHLRNCPWHPEYTPRAGEVTGNPCICATS